MVKKITKLFLALLLAFSFTISFGQEYDSITKKKYTLIFKSTDAHFSNETRKQMIDAFFKIYPKLVKDFNKTAAKKVVFIIDTAYKGVAATGGGVIRYNPKWFKDHPEDIDVVTHEAMHVVQDYKRSVGPGWLTEGIADYVRYKYGVNNIKAKWQLPDYKETHKYNNSYRITARFLLWLEQNGYKNLVTTLDKSLRDHTYTEEVWKQQTGKTVDELWSDYIKNPVVKVRYK